jgi:hypothetical protein
MNPAGRCPVCGTQLPARDRQRGGRKPRYCSGACKAKAYRGRRPSAPHAGTAQSPLPPTAAARHARAIEIRQQISELTTTLTETASGQQPLFPSAPARRFRPASTAAVLHQLISELAMLATAAPRTSRPTIAPAATGTPQTAPLFPAPGTREG